MDFLLFCLNGQLCALALPCVLRVIPIVAFTPIPHAPKGCCGAINMHGQIVPVIDLRILLGMSEKAVELSDRLLICTLDQQIYALWIDHVEQLIHCPPHHLLNPPQSQSQGKISGIGKMLRYDHKMVMVLELNALISKEMRAAIMI